MEPHYCMLIVEQLAEGTSGRVLFWHKSAGPDVTEAVALWGKPIGSAFGTLSETWFINGDRARCVFGPLADRAEVRNV